MVRPALPVLSIFIPVAGLMLSGSARVPREQWPQGQWHVQACLMVYPVAKRGRICWRSKRQVKTQGARVKQSKNSTAEVCYCIFLTSAQCTHSHAVMSEFPQVATSTIAGTASHMHRHDSDPLELCSCSTMKVA